MPDLSMQGGYTKTCRCHVLFIQIINLDKHGYSDNKIAISTKIYIIIKLHRATSNSDLKKVQNKKKMFSIL